MRAGIKLDQDSLHLTHTVSVFLKTKLIRLKITHNRVGFFVNHATKL